MPLQKLKFVWLAAACCFYAGLAGHAAYVETPTIDEYQELPAGLNYWVHGDLRLEAGNPPIAKLWASLPLLMGGTGRFVVPEYHPKNNGMDPIDYGRAFEVANRENFLKAFFPARLMIVLSSLAVAVLIFLAATRYCSAESALIAMSLFLFSPTVLAHGHLATCDMVSTLTIFASWYAFRRTDKWLPGLLLGIAIGTKFTAILLVPFFFVWLALQSKKLKLFIKQFSFLTIALFVGLAASYEFQRVGVRWSELSLQSKQMLALPIPAWFPTPFPAAFASGIDEKFRDIGGGDFYSYLLGTWSNKGFADYYLIAFALKETIAVVLIAIASLIFALGKRTMLPIVLPLLIILISLSIGNPQQLGLRYLLPAYPFLFVLIGCALEKFPRRNLVGVVLVLLSFVSALTVAPSFIGYFNSAGLAFVGGKDFKLLADSNLDWGQDLYRLPNYMRENLLSGPIGLMYWGATSPANYAIDFYLPSDRGPRPGLVAVSANFLIGYDFLAPTPDGSFTWVETRKWSWMKDLKFKERLGSLFLFTFEPLPRIETK